MTIRTQANRLLTVAQIALRSGEWDVGFRDPSVAIRNLEIALAAPISTEAVEVFSDLVAEELGAAMVAGDWVPGDWASEWQGVVEPMFDAHEIVPFMTRDERYDVRRDQVEAQRVLLAA